MSRKKKIIIAILVIAALFILLMTTAFRTFSEAFITAEIKGYYNEETQILLNFSAKNL